MDIADGRILERRLDVDRNTVGVVHNRRAAKKIIQKMLDDREKVIIVVTPYLGFHWLTASTINANA